MRRPIIVQGFAFGMVLQLAVGPVCLFVLQTGMNSGLYSGSQAAWGAVSVDALEMALASLGIGALLECRPQILFSLRALGAVVLFCFGVSALSGAMDPSLSPGAPFLPSRSVPVFFEAALLTLSNPLTLLFWAGLFSVRLSEKQYSRKDMLLFSAGCLSATIVFLHGAALAGRLAGIGLPTDFIPLLNGAVGLWMIGLAVQCIVSMKKGPS